MKRVIGVVTSARADYGILRSLITALARDKSIALRLFVTGSHLENRYGNTGKVVELEFGRFVEKVNINSKKSSLLGASSVLGLGSIEFAKVFEKARPDILVMVGDRFEILGIAAAAVIYGIPIAHLHGGERTDGAVDEFIRHAVTKLSTFHFTTTKVYKERVLQMGEDPKRVWHVGAPGLDQIRQIKFISKSKLSKDLKIDLSKTTAICTFHPETRSGKPPSCRDMISAIEASGIQCIFSAPNADPGNELIAKEIEEAVKRNKKFVLVKNLGTESYLSAIKHTKLMIGNSSSGVIEAPSLGAAVINIGNRQAGRVRSKHVIDVPLNKKEIIKAINKAVSTKFRDSLKNERNPYDLRSNAGLRIKSILKTVSLSQKRPFVDLNL